MHPPIKQGFYWAFSDAVEKYRHDTYIRFDVIGNDDFESLKSHYNVKIKHKAINNDESDYLYKLFNNMKTFLIEITLQKGYSNKFKGLKGRSVKLERWYKLFVGNGSHRSHVFQNPELKIPEYADVSDIIYLNRNNKDVHILEELISLKDINDADEADLKRALDIPKLSEDSRYVIVHNVGQGSCLSLSLRPLTPYLYFDFGGGFGINASTYPEDTHLCLSNNPPIVLSHWDIDHWISGRKFPDAMNSKWIVPRQRMGATHLKFALDLHQKKNLLIWPIKTNELEFSWGRFLKLSSSQNRNYSGLVFVANTCKGNVLCPGDTLYRIINSTSYCGLTGIVATHHGGNYKGDRPPAAILGNRVVYSFGAGNPYGHPSAKAVKKHCDEGWTEIRCTPCGHTVIP